MKIQQNIRGLNSEDVKDAIGDILIFTCGYCNLSGIGFDACYMTVPRFYEREFDDHFAQLLQQVDGLFSAKNKGVDIRLGYVTRIVSAVKHLCHSLKLNPDEILHLTWNRVESRDWVKFPTDGRTK